ncbi:MAG: hypothetical protein MUE96_06880 [Bacteroidia bacterium]|jgi:hypothetical protein|nr:hypothetical protein [Bacteroidia bacterium]
MAIGSLTGTFGDWKQTLKQNLVVTNINAWFIFDATLFDSLFAQNKN